MCGLHIVVHADELEELINYYQVMKGVFYINSCYATGIPIFNVVSPLFRIVDILKNW